MKALILALALVPLGGSFGEATASITPVDGQMEVELTVEIGGSASSVVVHIVLGGDTELDPVALDHRGGGVFGGFIRLPVQDAVVVFERIDGQGGELSAPTTLAALGADFSPFGDSVEILGPSEDDGDGLSNSSRQWLWLAIASGAAALSALAFWVITDRDQSDDDESSDEVSAGTSVDDA